MNTALLKLIGVGIAAGLVARYFLKTTLTVALIVGFVAALVIGSVTKASS